MAQSSDIVHVQGPGSTERKNSWVHLEFGTFFPGENEEWGKSRMQGSYKVRRRRGQCGRLYRGTKFGGWGSLRTQTIEDMRLIWYLG